MWVETKCMHCGRLHETDLNGISDRESALKHAGENWGWCETCRHADDYYCNVKTSPGHHGDVVVRREIPHGVVESPPEGDRIKLPLRNLIKEAYFRELDKETIRMLTEDKGTEKIWADVKL